MGQKRVYVKSKLNFENARFEQFTCYFFEIKQIVV